MKKVVYILLLYSISIILAVDLFSQFNTDYVGGIYTPQIDTPYIAYNNPNLLNRNAVNTKKYKIRSITEATQYYRKWKFEDTLYYENKYEYDTNGCLIKWKYLNTFITILQRHGDFTRDPIDSALYIYNSENLVSEKINYHKAYNSFIKYNYDARGNLIQLRNIYDTLDSYTDTNFFEFDTVNNLINEKEYWDYANDTIFVVYDRINKLKLICNSVYPDRKKEKLWEITYSINKDTVYTTDYRYYAVFTDKYIFKKNNLELEYSFLNDIKHTVEHFSYNLQNQIIKKKTEWWQLNEMNYYNYPLKTSFTEYIYNSKGFLYEIITYYSNWKPSYKKVFIYEYYE
ncbi:MAG TPA: hypothetical protein PK605_10920 [Ignavibacteria bacterium]|nr:hypothetical protein [Bacteroidota bacterium]HRE11570.1 hypothetical protein [Ignavibacteria bacterium]HRF65716.1 hypothetical protein [Ignavibacteria bacterium]HRJ04902.1 hypothetical protein [Ignavibacteria bacterium]HRJ85472.1 hypothetical protein [Ignavibacteria bacterium]